MSRSVLLAGAAALLGMAAPARAAADPAAACQALTTIRMPDLRITEATFVGPQPRWTSPPMHQGEAGIPVAQPLCRVQGVIEGEIGFEQWLPLPAAWNGRLLGNGNGGFAGFIRYDGLALGLARGFASVSTDTGHREGEKNWSIGRPRLLEDYGHRAQHLVTIDAKAIAAAFYGQAPRRSYFLGCSGGGMQAMNEAQRYPADYDGIIASAAGQSIAGISARWLQSALIARATPAASPSPADWARIQAHAVAQCDKADGLADGVVARPDRCRARIVDTAGVDAAKRTTAEWLAAPIRGADGTELFAGFAPGVAVMGLPDPGLASEAFAQWLYRDPTWDPARFQAARDLPALENAVPGLRFTDPDLSAFAARGGKLIAAQGWTDPIVPAQSTIDYYGAVARYLGPTRTDSFFRLFLAPGVDHCAGGAGADSFTMAQNSVSPITDADHDLLAALVAWVEEGRAPERMIASKLEDGRVVETRPVCAYPAAPRYSGRGDPRDAASFACTDD